MADSKPEQEPSIEEILASIRQIISDDDAQPESAESDPEPDEEAPEAAIPPIETPAEPPSAEEESEEVLELTENMQEAPEHTDNIEEDSDLDEGFDIALAEINETLAADGPEPAMLDEDDTEDDMVAAPPPPEAEESAEDIISDKAAEAATASMAKLAAGMPISKPEQTAHHYDGVTLEDIVRDLLNPMLREWMDENLPPMVERLVQKELEKLARKAMDG